MVQGDEPETTVPADAVPSKGLASGLQKHLVVVSLRVDQENDGSLAEDLDVLDRMSVLGALHCQLRILGAWPRLPTLPCECHSGFFIVVVHCCLPDNWECFLWKAQLSGTLPFLCTEQVLFNRAASIVLEIGAFLREEEAGAP